MEQSIIARNYAETLLALAQKQGGDQAVDEYGALIGEIAEMLRREPLVRDFLETPRVGLETKQKALEAAFGGRAPKPFVRFLLVVVEKRRQTILEAIANQYQDLVDEVRGRVRAEITLAREPDETLRNEIVASLEKRLGKRLVPSFRVDSTLIGGIIVKAGGEILDGSLRRRAAGLRRRMLETTLPAAAANGSAENSW
jgi:F-type H+-transporting ATPase subunit delta